MIFSEPLDDINDFFIFWPNDINDKSVHYNTNLTGNVSDVSRNGWLYFQW